MDTRKLELLVGLYDEPVIIDKSSDNDDEVGRIYTTGDDDFDESDRIPFGEELVRRWNEYPRQAERIAKLEKALADMVSTTDKVEDMMDGDKDKQKAWTEELGRLYAALDDARTLLQTLKA